MIIYLTPLAVERKVCIAMRAMHDRSAHRCARNVWVALDGPSSLLLLLAKRLATPRTQPRLVAALCACSATIVSPRDQWREHHRGHNSDTNNL